MMVCYDIRTYDMSNVASDILEYYCHYIFPKGVVGSEKAKKVDVRAPDKVDIKLQKKLLLLICWSTLVDVSSLAVLLRLMEATVVF